LPASRAESPALAATFWMKSCFVNEHPPESGNLALELAPRLTT
jgi:hypothetical protein